MMNKLRDRRGASLLMALLLLLLATMVSVVILTAVSSAARHLSRDREAQQNYLTVSSAAELLRSGIKGAKYTRGRGPVSVVYREACAGRSAALKREAAIKRLTRSEKEKLIRG